MVRFTSLLAVLFFTIAAFATVRTVDNSSSALPGSYTTVQAAHDAATSGDTVFVIGSGNVYGSLTTTKPLKWFGPGYWLAQNTETQANTGSARIAGIAIDTGSAGSMFAGFQIESMVNVNTGNILISRCLIFANATSTVSILSGLSNVIVQQSYIYSTNASASVIALNSSHSISVLNCLVYNNANAGYNAIVSNSDGGPYNVINNIVFGNIDVYNGVIDNNIMLQGNFSALGSGYNNNISNSTQFGNTNGNLQNVSMVTVFTNNPVSSDAYYTLSATSVARGAGVGGVDCGIFGGTNPYVLSGVPPLPTITYLNAPTTGSTVGGLPVTFRARGHN